MFFFKTNLGRYISVFPYFGKVQSVHLPATSGIITRLTGIITPAAYL